MFARATKEPAKTRAVSTAPARAERPRAADQALEPETLAVEFERATASRGPQWSFSKIPLFPPGGNRPPPHIRLQRKLAIGSVDDPLEREADAVGDAVMRMPDPALAVSAAPPQVSRKCAECEEEEKKLQMKPAAASPASAAGEAPPIVHEVLRQPGRPLDAETRAFFEPRLGYDFGLVRLHTGPAADAAAGSIQAHAFTVGEHIVFAAGQSPGTPARNSLLAHELAHVVQQARGDVPTLVARAHNPDPSQSGSSRSASLEELHDILVKLLTSLKRRTHTSH
jgi:hypothetical protein